ncbi:TPR end-of-group domain-containing protein [Leptospira santarosai]|uniref:Uncharacterized protein n=1 Tax=Leptospira santarosai str. MOR084 TaxID=1049984 RepID=A0A0E2BEM3_9LEPT|nr:hypothetical protein [Leptospira santarosai]EKO33664.1 hypothetical protein LEP1GSC179_3230 [Leptospira santarosai str. MOR084]EMP01080.1 hypothetical protein LEP1GSC171_3549 [Leptospira santarosai str. HAI1380]
MIKLVRSRSGFSISLTRRLQYSFYAIFIVLCFSVSAEKNQIEETKKDSVDFEQKIPDENTVSDWRKQTNNAWKAWIKSEDTESSSETKSEFETAYFSSIKLYIQGTDSFKSELRDEVVDWTYNTLYYSLVPLNLQRANYILKSYYTVTRTIGIGNKTVTGLETGTEFNLREAFAAHIILYMDEAQDFQYESFLKEMIPEKITDSILAFNIACLHANRGEKQQMLKYTKLAIDLGQSKKHFGKNPGFEKFWKDPDFLKLIQE